MAEELIVWDAINSTGAWILSNSDRSAKSHTSSGVDAIESVQARSSGKRYLEILYHYTQSFTAAGVRFDVGISRVLAAEGEPTRAIGSIGVSISGAVFYNGTQVTSMPTDPIPNDCIIQFAVDFDNNRSWLGINGTWLTGDPSTGTSPTFTGMIPGWYRVAGTYEANGAEYNIYTIQGTTDEQTYSKPTGYQSWSGDSVPIPETGMEVLSPIFNDPQFFDNDGLPLSGGKIFTYIAGSYSIEMPTYTSITGVVPNTNPIVLDSSGRSSTAIWLAPGIAYNLVLTKADGTTILRQFDNISGVGSSSGGGGGGGGGSTSIWTLESLAPTYVSANQFLITGDKTTDFAVGNRVRFTLTTGYGYGVVTTSAFGGTNTTVTLQLDGTAMDSSLSAVEWSVLIAAGRTVDAGGVGYSSTLSYSGTNTVGAQINLAETNIGLANTRIDSTYKVWGTSGSGTNTPYVISPSPTIASYSVGQIFTVQFASASSGVPTLNVNSLGAVPLKMYDSSGNLVTAVIPVNNISEVAYDGTNFVYLDQVPPVPVTFGSIPHGEHTFISNSVFTVPANVYYLTVTCIGAGGGGGGAYTTGVDPVYLYAGGVGGYGGAAVKTFAVTPGATYNVSIGAGGTGSTGGSGSAGGSTTFGASVVSATGGGGGSYGTGNQFGVLGTPGYNGYVTAGDYGLSEISWYSGSDIKGKGGTATDGVNTASNGYPGMCIVQW